MGYVHMCPYGPYLRRAGVCGGLVNIQQLMEPCGVRTRIVRESEGDDEWRRDGVAEGQKEHHEGEAVPVCVG
eukprot:50841-Eustigmatos_ZCMA.PRE.1